MKIYTVQYARMGEMKTWENRGKTRKALDFTPHLYTTQGHYFDFDWYIWHKILC